MQKGKSRGRFKNGTGLGIFCIRLRTRASHTLYAKEQRCRRKRRCLLLTVSFQTRQRKCAQRTERRNMFARLRKRNTGFQYRRQRHGFSAIVCRKMHVETFGFEIRSIYFVPFAQEFRANSIKRKKETRKAEKTRENLQKSEKRSKIYLIYHHGKEGLFLWY